MAIFIKILPIL
jgi:phosphatidylinositol glycan class P protein